MPLKRRKKSCFSLALETETIETTWFSNARANFYNEHLGKNPQIFHHFAYNLKKANLFYFMLVIFASQTSWVQKVEQLGKSNKNCKEKGKKQTTEKEGDRTWNCAKIWRKVETTSSLSQRVDSRCLGFCTNSDFSSLARNANAERSASSCFPLRSVAGVTIAGADGTIAREAALAWESHLLLPRDPLRVPLHLWIASHHCWKTLKHFPGGS